MTDVTAAAPARPVRELLPHLVWEAVLLIAALGVTIGLYADNADVFSKGAAWTSLAFGGFLATGLALSLRTGTPNLAVGQLAVLAGWIYATENSIGAAVLAAAGVGLAMALLTGLTGLPAWAVTLAGGGGVQAWLLSQSQGGVAPVLRGVTPPSYGMWATAFAVASIGGGVLLAVPAVRRFLAANRPAGGEAGAFSGAKFVGALVGVGGSAVIAGLAGVLQVLYLRAATPFDSGLLIYALPAVLLGGVSVLGRRAGIFGVVLAVVIVDFTRRWELLHAASTSTVMLTVTGYAVLGLLVVWLLELIGRRASPLVGPVPATAPATAPGFAPFPPPPGYAGFGGAPPPGYPVAAPPVSAPPVAAPAVSAPPVSGPPVPGPPPRDDSWPDSPPPSWPPAP
jgi:ribose/xylose/arabinose/galactoside ABC-type transport system permease subunit